MWFKKLVFDFTLATHGYVLGNWTLRNYVHSWYVMEFRGEYIVVGHRDYIVTVPEPLQELLVSRYRLGMKYFFRRVIPALKSLK